MTRISCQIYFVFPFFLKFFLTVNWFQFFLKLCIHFCQQTPNESARLSLWIFYDTSWFEERAVSTEYRLLKKPLYINILGERTDKFIQVILSVNSNSNHFLFLIRIRLVYSHNLLKDYFFCLTFLFVFVDRIMDFQLNKKLRQVFISMKSLQTMLFFSFFVT